MTNTLILNSDSMNALEFASAAVAAYEASSGRDLSISPPADASAETDHHEFEHSLGHGHSQRSTTAIEDEDDIPGDYRSHNSNYNSKDAPRDRDR